METKIMTNNSLKVRVLENCSEKWNRQFHIRQSATGERQWVKVTPEIIYQLLENVSGIERMKARHLLYKMADSKTKWRIDSTAKTGGIGDERGPDPDLHITISTCSPHRKKYHLKCKENSRGGLYVFRITE